MLSATALPRSCLDFSWLRTVSIRARNAIERPIADLPVSLCQSQRHQITKRLLQTCLLEASIFDGDQRGRVKGQEKNSTRDSNLFLSMNFMSGSFCSLAGTENHKFLQLEKQTIISSTLNSCSQMYHWIQQKEGHFLQAMELFCRIKNTNP